MPSTRRTVDQCARRADALYRDATELERQLGLGEISLVQAVMRAGDLGAQAHATSVLVRDAQRRARFRTRDRAEHVAMRCESIAATCQQFLVDTLDRHPDLELADHIIEALRR